MYAIATIQTFFLPVPLQHNPWRLRRRPFLPWALAGGHREAVQLRRARSLDAGRRRHGRNQIRWAVGRVALHMKKRSSFSRNGQKVDKTSVIFLPPPAVPVIVAVSRKRKNPTLHRINNIDRTLYILSCDFFLSCARPVLWLEFHGFKGFFKREQGRGEPLFSYQIY